MTKTDNLLQDDSNNPVIDNDTVVTDQVDADDFFASLDRQVNSVLTEDDNKSDVMGEGNQAQQKTVEKHPADKGDDGLTMLQKRYGDSSREAKRLNNRLQELEPYAPLLDAFKEDPNLIKHVQDYFEGGGQSSKDVKERLGLDEDFVYDGDEALSNPESDSGRLFNTVVDNAVNKRLIQHQKQQSVQNRRVAEKREFINKHDLSDDEYQEIVDFAKTRTLTLDDILLLKTRDGRDKNVAESTKKDMLNQMKSVRQKPASLSSTGGSSVAANKTAEDSLFDAILGIDKQLDNAFG